MFFRSLQWRLVFIYILITLFLIIPIGLLLNKRVESASYDTFKRGIDRGFDNWSVKEDTDVDGMIRTLDENKEAITLFNIIGTYKSYTIINKDNVNDIKFSSDSIYNEEGADVFLNQILASENLLAVMAGSEIGNSSKLIRTGERSFFDYAKLVTLSDGEYILYFRCDSGEWKDIIRNFNDIIISTLMLAIIFSLVVGYLLSKTITVPISRITHKTESLAAGDFDQKLEVKSDDEIGKLTTSFNYMAKSLKDTLAEISSEKNKIETILNYMTDGIVAFNINGEVIHVNPAAKRMTGMEKFDITFSGYAKKAGVDVSLEGLLNDREDENTEVTINVNDKTIRIYFAVFKDENKNPEGVIAVLQDVTQQQKLENMRREFVANVSHELRTPLTSIKSYTETLLDGAMEEKEVCSNFLEVINSEADRMTRLVKDLLQLSRLDNNQMQWNMEKVCIQELIKKTVERMKITAANKKQKLEYCIEGEIPEIEVDADRIEQVLINIIGNAIKYTLENGKIRVDLSSTSEEVRIKVTDTGIGIPKEDISRISERFYRVDKARSRQMGGTGLGLSIAREIIEAHKGSIEIRSEVDKGTEVTVKLPVQAKQV